MEQTTGKQKRDALLSNKKNGWDRVDAATEAAIDSYCQGYKIFLDRGKHRPRVLSPLSGAWPSRAGTRCTG